MTARREVRIQLAEAMAAVLERYIEAVAAGARSGEIDGLVIALKDVRVNRVDAAGAVAAMRSIAALEALLAQAPPAGHGLHVLRDDLATGGSALAYAPALAAGHDGPLVAWLEYSSEAGDQVGHRVLDAAAGERPATLGEPGLFVRPTVAVSSTTGDAWLLHGRIDDERSSVVVQPLADGVCGPPEVIGDDAAQAFNQDARIAADGTLHVVYQASIDGRFAILLRSRSAGGWGAVEAVSSVAEHNAWDPTIVIGPDGEICVVWCAWSGDRYRVYLRRRTSTGVWATPVEVPTHGGRHAVHPHADVAPDGAFWIVYDSIEVPGHGGSGATRYRPRSEVGRQGAYSPTSPYAIRCGVGVVRYDSSGFTEGATLDVHAGASSYPKVAVSTDGRVWLAHRQRTQVPVLDYLSHVVVRTLRGTIWSQPFVLPESDGAGEPAIVAGAREVTIAWIAEDHERRYRAMLHSLVRLAEEGRRPTVDERRREHLEAPDSVDMPTGGHTHAGLIRVARIADEAVDQRPSELPEQSFGLETTPAPGIATPVRPAVTRTLDVNRSARAGAVPERQLFWGDLHRHSNISRCAAGLDVEHDDQYRFAQDVYAYDFWALTDHAENTSDFNWHSIKKLVNLFHQPGSHVPLLGFEWTSFRFGHLNVIYDRAEGPIFSAAERATDNPAKLWRALGDRAALTIPHHPSNVAFVTDWSYRNDRFLRLAEVFQAATGSYESDWTPRQFYGAIAAEATIEAALNGGHRIGLIGSTDHRYGSTYVGVHADHLERASIFDALRERRCFGATQRGIEPILSIGRAQMGETLAYHAARGAEITFGGSGYAELAKVELIRNGQIVATAETADPAAAAWLPLDLQIRSGIGGPRTITGGITVSAGGRIIETGWYPPEVVRVADNEVGWETIVPKRYGNRDHTVVVGLAATIDPAPGMVIAITVGPARWQLTVDDLAGSEIVTLRDGDVEVRVRRGTGGLTGLGAADMRLTAPGDLIEAGAWYYTRVIQVDGEMAWSSPIWID